MGKVIIKKLKIIFDKMDNCTCRPDDEIFSTECQNGCAAQNAVDKMKIQINILLSLNYTADQISKMIDILGY